MGVCMLIIGLGLWFSCLPYLPYYTLNIPWCFWWLITYKSSYFLVRCSYLPQAKNNTPEIGLGIIILVFEKQTSRSNLGNFFADLLIFHLFWVDNLFFFSCMKCDTTCKFKSYHSSAVQKVKEKAIIKHKKIGREDCQPVSDYRSVMQPSVLD